MKKIIYWVAAFLCMACSDDHGSNQENGGASGSVTEAVSYTHLDVYKRQLLTEPMQPKPGELLNTELRIFALIRLGITDLSLIHIWCVKATGSWFPPTSKEMNGNCTTSRKTVPSSTT